MTGAFSHTVSYSKYDPAAICPQAAEPAIHELDLEDSFIGIDKNDLRWAGIS
jgi:hypothetical protein